MTLDCPLRCPLVTCPDGSCANQTQFCPQQRYNSPGNGCLQGANDQFYCVCQQGYSGVACEFARCDPTSSDPYLACKCGWMCPLRAMPPQLDVFDNYTTAELVALNYRYHIQNGSNDVAMRYLQYSCAPYGPIIATWRAAASGSVLSACPYAKRGPRGQYLTLDRCINEQNEYGQVLSWNSFPDYNGNMVPCVWANVFAYDDFPVPCPNNRHCVSNLQQCAQLDKTDPLCHGKGVCRADGSCDFSGPVDVRLLRFTDDTRVY